MFCPECKAEYRPGFTHCVDCDVDLVDGPGEAARASIQAPPEKYGALLWEGKDPHFYLSLLGSLQSLELPCCGMPRSPQPSNGESAGYENVEPGAFQVWVSEESLARAKWILESAGEKYEEAPAEDREPLKSLAAKQPSEEGVKVCPLCFAEFETDSPLCPNCNVPFLLHRPESNEDTGARELCDLWHPRFAVELRQALQAAGIPFNNSNYAAADAVTGRSYVPNYPLLVLDSDFDRATRVMAQALQRWEFEPTAGFGLAKKSPKAFWPQRADENGWQLRDLEMLLWSGRNLAQAFSIGKALQEHHVPHRVDDAEIGVGKIFIHPEDEAGAREIMAQVVEGVPPAES